MQIMKSIIKLAIGLTEMLGAASNI